MEMNIKQNKQGNARVIYCENKEGCHIYEFTYESEGKKVPDPVEVIFYMPVDGVFSVWNPVIGTRRTLPEDWRENLPICYSRLMYGLPVHTLLSQNGENCLTLSVSDYKNPVQISSGTHEGQTFACKFTFFADKMQAISDYRAFIYLDERKRPFYDIIADRVNRLSIEKEISAIPDAANMPMYSTWYSFLQNISEEALLEQCKYAKSLGMESIIVDDGWQTADQSLGYAYCGEWVPCEEKFPDMKKFVNLVHEADMKVLLWYPVPYVGKKTKIWKQFEGKYLDSPEQEWNCLDPRFPEVREFLIATYEKALDQWDLDGFKLDFIDAFQLTEYSDTTGTGRDFDSLEKAVECLLQEIFRRLRKKKPNIMIEFRQNYTGPGITPYGNIMRVGDCALDCMNNRMGIADLRMTVRNMAIHSDMLIWSPEDTPENAAKQIIAIFLGVPQISVLLDQLPDTQFAVLKNYLSLWREHREVIVNGKLIPYHPESNYSKLESILEERCVCVCYTEQTVDIRYADTLVVNGTGEDRIILCASPGVDISIQIQDCMGNRIEQRKIRFTGSTVGLKVPVSGTIKVKEIEKQEAFDEY